MPLRPETVRERLALVRSNLETLSAAASLARDRFLADQKEQWSAAHGPQSTAQALLAAGAHIRSGRFKDVPRNYAEMVPLLVRHGVLDGSLGDRIAKVSGFRNVLVHEYAAVDYGVVHQTLQRLDDLRAFAAALERWVTAEGL